MDEVKKFVAKLTEKQYNKLLQDQNFINLCLHYGKICTKCKEFKSNNDFNKDKTRKDNLNRHCKDCKKSYVCEPSNIVVKICSNCNQVKPICNFNIDCRNKDVYYCICKNVDTFLVNHKCINLVTLYIARQKPVVV